MDCSKPSPKSWQVGRSNGCVYLIAGFGKRCKTERPLTLELQKFSSNVRRHPRTDLALENMSRLWLPSFVRCADTGWSDRHVRFVRRNTARIVISYAQRRWNPERMRFEETFIWNISSIAKPFLTDCILTYNRNITKSMILERKFSAITFL